MYRNLKAFREKLDLTQKEFAKSLGIGYTTYNGYETGARDPKSDFWIMVAQKYGVSIDYLMGYSNSPYKEPTQIGNEKESGKIVSFGGDMILDKSEKELIKKYRDLDDRGKDLVMCVIDRENAYLDEEVETFAIADTGQQKTARITRRKAIEARKQWLLMKDDAYDELRRALEGEFAPKEDSTPDGPETKE